ncbi:MAG: hypothetical protein HKP48_09330 [Winogradskyella sp.]|uniref:hypothetical protein n=1 Tax=Winogradskyella sp. TaxID=1883156 RepID=UPI0017F1F993|nr:hypothetical protein [Winogradskyella sp.]MBT8244251.1 hypothetical protein [Winogradskyella sp.]NNK23472.1 hypothetical protein [Winogradskyella sp.]
MIKSKLIIVLLLVSSSVFCQKSTLIQNINFRAKELKHYLNKSEDSLILEAEYSTIYSVNIFNKNYNTSIEVNKNKTVIPISNLDIGRYVVEAILRDKRIIITLLRNEPFLDPPKIENLISEKRSYLLNYKKAIASKPKKIEKKSTYLYWVYSVVNSGPFSKKIKKMANLDDAERMIQRNQLDIKTLKGQSNILIIWEVYDKKMFFKHKVLDKDYLYRKSPYFNSKPYYTTESYGLEISSNY